MAYRFLRADDRVEDRPEPEVRIVEIEVEPKNRVTDEWAGKRKSKTNLGIVVSAFGFVLVLLSVLLWDSADITVLLVGCGIIGFGGYMVDPGTVSGYAGTIKGFLPGKK